MSLSPVNLHDLQRPVPDASLLEPEDDPPNQENEPNWLTVRRRCELCKQRKVRLIECFGMCCACRIALKGSLIGTTLLQRNHIPSSVRISKDQFLLSPWAAHPLICALPEFEKSFQRSERASFSGAAQKFSNPCSLVSVSGNSPSGVL